MSAGKTKPPTGGSCNIGRRWATSGKLQGQLCSEPGRCSGLAPCPGAGPQWKSAYMHAGRRSWLQTRASPARDGKELWRATDVLIVNAELDPPRQLLVSLAVRRSLPQRLSCIRFFPPIISKVIKMPRNIEARKWSYFNVITICSVVESF